MDAQKLQLKFFVLAPNGLQLEPFVPVFHDWIRKNLLGTETLIDVADYTHVHHGPAVLLVGHQSDYYIDLGQGRPGLLFSRKREALAEPGANIRDAFRRALYACSLLERETTFKTPLRFATDEVLFRINDRLRAPNTPDGFLAVRAELEKVVQDLFGGAPDLCQEGSAKELLSIRIKLDKAPSLATLLDRAGGPPS